MIESSMAMMRPEGAMIGSSKAAVLPWEEMRG